MFKKILHSFPVIFTFIVLVVLFIGWRLRDDELITPGHGMGLVFGITGTAMMIILLIYPFRKRVRGVEAIGNVKTWFRIHMILGILGPVFILFHSNFHFGAMNSNVALICMLIVSGSGIIGRYIYGKIHHGLYGEKANLNELKQRLLEQNEQVQNQFEIPLPVKEKLAGFVNATLGRSEGFLDSFFRLFEVRFQAIGLLAQVGLTHRNSINKESRRIARNFINHTVKVSEFNFFERLFSYWHMLHLPLVFILAFAIVLHVLAVNRY